jgi:hypothetical protein
MNIIKVSGLVAVAGMLLIAAPANRALAASVAGPGIAAAVQSGVLGEAATEVRWRGHWRHRHWRRHHGWRHRHWHRRHWRRW